jgi:restriction system protein
MSGAPRVSPFLNRSTKQARKVGDVGLIVSSGGFTAEVERETRASSKHIEMTDLGRLIKLWQQYYDQIREAGKLLLPMVKLFFLAPPEE